MQTERKALKKIWISYCIFFFAVWSVFHFFVEGWLDRTITIEWQNQLIKSGLIKNLVWTLPAWLLLQRYAENAYVKPKVLFRFHRDCFKWLWVFVLFAIYLLIGAYRQHGSLQIQPDFGVASIIIVLFVGLTEEMVFRGWLLNVTYSDKNKWLAIGANAVLFLMIHFPTWIMDGIFVSSFTSFGFVCILVLSVIFSLAFIKTKNLLLPIGLHMFWDLLMFLFY